MIGGGCGCRSGSGCGCGPEEGHVVGRLANGGGAGVARSITDLGGALDGGNAVAAGLNGDKASLF